MAPLVCGRSVRRSGDEFAEGGLLVAAEAQGLVVAHAAQGAPDAALDRADADAEDVGDLRVGAALVVAEHQHGALLLGQPGERLPEDGAQFGAAHLVGVADRLGQLLGRVLVELAAPPGADVQVGHGAPQVAADGRLVADPVPCAVRGEQRALQQVLGREAVTGEVVRGRVEGGAALLDVRGELRLRVRGGGLRRRGRGGLQRSDVRGPLPDHRVPRRASGAAGVPPSVRGAGHLGGPGNGVRTRRVDGGGGAEQCVHVAPPSMEPDAWFPASQPVRRALFRCGSRLPGQFHGAVRRVSQARNRGRQPRERPGHELSPHFIRPPEVGNNVRRALPVADRG
ncbi:Putative ECF subfamily RNA polymerase sigma factor [Actinacidiphila bryophytorum]|uniref:ECF subfamily RNA polymerase sigma factor n=1 Tax=Actinacidiphila bryophytorum TaxID=1436133 RepID=A0A9W4E2W4_9ACTN|nr:Putative ECF subfamily RNA polymerase sigma factor [Actinacidiphila bryophytorum]